MREVVWEGSKDYNFEEQSCELAGGGGGGGTGEGRRRGRNM